MFFAIVIPFHWGVCAVHVLPTIQALLHPRPVDIMPVTLPAIVIERLAPHIRRPYDYDGEGAYPVSKTHLEC
jgi:hypothetical protein